MMFAKCTIEHDLHAIKCPRPIILLNICTVPMLFCFITATCAGLVGNGMTVFQYDDNVEGSVLTISCLEGYILPEGDVEFVCTSNGSWSPDPLDYHCENGKRFVYHLHIYIGHIIYIFHFRLF